LQHTHTFSEAAIDSGLLTSELLIKCTVAN
jgi:hypothetical protein